MYGVPLVWGIGGGVLPLPLGLYNELHVTSRCWLESPPAAIAQDCTAQEELGGLLDCAGSAPANQDGIDPHLLRHLLAGLPGCIALAIVIGCNVMVYVTVRNAERRMARYATSTNTRQRKRTLQTASQARWYVCIFLNSIMWICVVDFLSIYEVITPENESSWTALILVSQLFSASAGFGFLLVCVRPRYLRLRENGDSRIQALKKGLKIRKAEVELSAGDRVRTRHDSRGSRDLGHDEDSSYVRTFISASSSVLPRLPSRRDFTLERPLQTRRRLRSSIQEEEGEIRSVSAGTTAGTSAGMPAAVPVAVKEEAAAFSTHARNETAVTFISDDSFLAGEEQDTTPHGAMK
jgi:hypothetical protein